MSESAEDMQDASILGKRERNGPNDYTEPEEADHASKKMAIEEESDDDDVGPMPLPADAVVAKKKRKGG